MVCVRHSRWGAYQVWKRSEAGVIIGRLAGAVLAVSLLSLAEGWGRSSAGGEQLRTDGYVGSEACAACHRAIFDSYSATAMARTSGPAVPNVIDGSFHHGPSGVSYRVQRQGHEARLSYERPGPRRLQGTQALKYYVGSNTRGRSFLFEIEGFLYRAPIDYYAEASTWAMSPGSSQAVEMPLNRPVDSSCLFCHSTRVQPPEEGTTNRFAGDAFLEPGVGCERCHGPGGAHVDGRGPMVNPAKLPDDRRDDVCIQCHLEGEARIAVAGRTQDEYTPGDRLTEYLAIFVRDDAASARLGAVSQVEALALSKCRQPSGVALSCLTCHDSHVQLSDTERVDSYRETCIQCHGSMADTHQPRQRDCTACHMPRLPSADIAHTMVTDHRIVRTDRQQRTAPGIGRLVEFGRPPARTRELGLAYGEVALRGDAGAAREALRLLEEALPGHERDPDVLTRLAHLYQMQGDMEQAERFYVRALEQDPARGIVAANVGVFYARRGMLRRALELWQNAFAHNPQLSDLGLNLANGLCAAGDATGARQVVRRVLEHNPDLAAAQKVLAGVTHETCSTQ